MATIRPRVLREVVRSFAQTGRGAATDRELLSRYARQNDQGAFEALVNRHSAMVLGVCRRALPTVQDAEDACQATFLVLAQRASGGGWQESIANWLYTTARRVADRARLASERRAKREARAAVPEAIELVDRMTVRELLAALDDALDQLPPRYREPLVLCYLEGLTRDEAATRLGVPLASLHTRIHRARKRLHEVLTKSGCALGAGLLALAVSSPAGASPPRVVTSILATVSGNVPADIGELTRGVAVNGSSYKVLLTTGVVALGVGLAALFARAADQPPEEQINTLSVAADKWAGAVPDRSATVSVKKEVEPLPEKFTYQGRAVGPDGKPVKDVQIYLHVNSPTPRPLVVRAESDAEGRYSFEIKRSEFDFRSYERSPAPWRNGHLIASAPGLGVAWAQDITPGRDTELAFSADNTPVEGRIRTLQGQPVVGAKVRVLWVFRPQSGDLLKWRDNPRRYPTGHLSQQGFLVLLGLQGITDSALRRHGLDVVIPPTTTGKDGRFTLKGLGRDRVALVRIEGDGIESRDVFVMTLPGEPKTVNAFVLEGRVISAATQTIDPRDTLLGTKFDLPVPPSRLVMGVVTDVDTGKPVPGVRVSSWQFPNGVLDRYRTSTVTDAQGRYTLGGLPVDKGNIIRADGPDEEPYVAITADVPDRAGLEPIRLDLRLKRGVWLAGNVLDRETKKPVSAWLHYSADADNPHLKPIPGLATELRVSPRMDNGGFRMAVLPGRGYLSVALEPANHPRYGTASDVPADLQENIMAKPFSFNPKSLNALIVLNPKADAKETHQDVLLTPGRGVVVTVVGPDGEKLKGLIASTDGLRAVDLNPDGTVTVRGISANQTKSVQLVCPEKKLAGHIQVSAKDNAVTLKLQPWLAAKGRIVDEDGQPVAGAVVSFGSSQNRPNEVSGFWYKEDVVRTDKSGRFEIEGLVPGAPYTLIKGDQSSALLQFRSDWKVGEVKDLGDIKLRP